MTEITLKGNTIHTVGTLPQVGSKAPTFTLTRGDLTDFTWPNDITSGQKTLLNIFPSLDTDVCANSVRQFNQKASALGDTQILCISADLPFAQGRFCETEGIDQVTTLSCFRHPDFAQQYGVAIVDLPLAGLLSRAIIVIDQAGKIAYTEQVPEITQEPNYEAALTALS